MLPIGIIVALLLFFFFSYSGAGYYPGEFLHHTFGCYVSGVCRTDAALAIKKKILSKLAKPATALKEDNG